MKISHIKLQGIIVHIFSITQICSDVKRSEVIISVNGTVRVKFLDFAQFLTKFLSHASIGVDVEATSILRGCNAVITYGVNFPHHRQTPTDGIEIKFQGAVILLFRRSMHGRLYRWTENSFPIFLYLKPVEISKKCFNIT